MELKALGYEVAEGVATVTLSRPERLNAWTNRMAVEYRWALGTADADPEVRVVVVTGAGRGFCAGADLQALDQLSAQAGYGPDGSAPPSPPMRALDSAPADFDHPQTFPLGMAKPVIAAVNGPAAGIGFVLMCFCDIRFAAEGAKLTTSFSRLGLPAEHGLSWLLPRLVGPARAADLLFSSRVVLAEEAAAMGLVNRVLPGADLLDETLTYARRMAAEISPASLRTIKRQLWSDQLRSLDESARESVELMERMAAGPDFAEGVAARAERRPPGFTPLPS